MRLRLWLAALLLAITGPACGQSLTASRFDVAPEALARYAEPTPALPSHQGRVAAEWIGRGVLGYQFGDAIHRAWTSGPRQDLELYCLAARAVLVVGASEGLKALTHRDRPDHSDSKSMPSEDTMFSVMLTDGKWTYAFPLAVGFGRMLANRHHPSDVIVGGLIGQGIKMIPCGPL